MNNILGIIPCAGTANRMNNIPKFLLPSPIENNTLFDNIINIFKNNNINNIIIGSSTKNEQYFKNKNLNYIIKNTNTMSETVKNMTNNFLYDKYILLMPDTFFYINNEIHKMIELLNKYDIVVILWKIRENQYGKLGQINIDKDLVIDIIDKDPNCKYIYSWGIIGWNKNMNNLIDINTQHIGYLINNALTNNIKIGYVISDSEYYDCGTYNEYFDMIKRYT